MEREYPGTATATYFGLNVIKLIFLKKFPNRCGQFLSVSCCIFLFLIFGIGLKGGGGPTDGQGTNFTYTFHGDPHATFATFFGGANPFEIFFGRKVNGRDDDDMEVDGGDAFSSFPGFNLNGFPRDRHVGLGGQTRRKQDPAIHHELRVSLEEVFHGCTKRMKISRKRLNPDGRTLRTEDKILTIDIKRGWKEGTKITFPREGDESPNTIPADIVFVIKDKPHPHFRREGSNIIYPVRVSLRQVRALALPTLIHFVSKSTLILSIVI